MAKAPKRLSGFIEMVSGIFPTTKIEEVLPVMSKPKSRLISDSQRVRLVESAINAKGVDAPRGTSFTDYIRRISTTAARDRVENNQILQMAPEVNQAMSIVWPAIVSPNDLKVNKLVISPTTPKISDDQRNKISRHLTDFFESHLSLSTSIVEWGKEAMYKTGAKPLLLLPVNAIERKLTDPSSLHGSTEAFSDAVKAMEAISIFGFADGQSRDQGISSIVAATEHLVGDLVGSTSYATEKDQKSRRRGGSYDRRMNPEAYKSFVSSVISTESLSMVDNPDTAVAGIVRNKTRKKKMSKQLSDHYREQGSDSVTINENDQVVDHPIVIELSKESVIPIFAPGNPNDPLGYIITLDDYGHPTDVSEFADKGLSSRFIDSSNTNNFNQLYQAFGYGSNPNVQDGVTMNARDHDVMADVYRNIVEAHIKDRLSNGGLANVNIGTNETVFRFMFSRYLQKRNTKLLFVPDELLTYFCFKRDANGMGVSKIEELKHILSLRTTLMTCRILSAVDQSIQRKKIVVNVPQDFEGDILEHVYNLMNASIKKATFQFGYDPMAIAAQVAEKIFTIQITGVPEFDYQINEELKDKGKIEIDEQLFEALTKLFVLGLDVPPAALNALSEDEYSRSVATMNLFFSRKVVQWQQVTCLYIGKFLRDFVTFSAPLRQKIEEVLKVDAEGKPTSLKRGPGEKVDEQGEITVTGITVVDHNDLVREVIKSLELSLPAPNIAPDTAQIDAISKLLDSTDRMITTAIPDDLAGGNEDLGRAITLSRSVARIGIMQDFFKSLGFTDAKIPMPDEVDLNRLLSIRAALFNTATAINREDALYTPAMGKDTLGGQDIGGADANGGDDGAGDDFGQENPDQSGTGDDFLDATGGNAGDDTGGGTPQDAGDGGTADETPGADDLGGPDAPNGKSVV